MTNKFLSPGLLAHLGESLTLWHNMGMKIYTFLASPDFPDSYVKKMEELGEYHVISAQKLSSSEIVEKYPDIEVLLATPSGMEAVDRELLDGLKKLKWV